MQEKEIRRREYEGKRVSEREKKTEMSGKAKRQFFSQTKEW